MITERTRRHYKHQSGGWGIDLTQVAYLSRDENGIRFTLRSGTSINFPNAWCFEEEEWALLVRVWQDVTK